MALFAELKGRGREQVRLSVAKDKMLGEERDVLKLCCCLACPIKYKRAVISNGRTWGP